MDDIEKAECENCHNCKNDVYDDFCRYYGTRGCGKKHFEPRKRETPEEFVSPCSNQWDFLKVRGQQANIPALKDAVNQLLHLSTAKSFKVAEQGQLDAFPMIKLTIICEATALVLNGELDRLEVSGSEEN